ncbi:MAG: HD domain-containing protein [Eubacteriales bacterium]|nr:HD domain-containing protein [Eubacteriales bacterium]MDD3883034.1 HD domain-containing protein [Eubacteriales bacterium]MDD4513639.1 HD domain-containing protein [Eubacteriales bacterium]
MRSLLTGALPTIFSVTDRQHTLGAAAMFAKIIDYKSAFTCRHSTGIAEKAMQLGRWKGWDDETCEKLYLAGALHDVGKLETNSLILEKPDKLTSEEFTQIQHHALASAELLGRIRGLEDVTSWAVNHHEKLDGSGYPHKKTAKELGEKERLMAAVDIYQALVEKRPYKDGMPHEKAIAIMTGLSESGKLDAYWVSAIDAAFSPDASCKSPS